MALEEYETIRLIDYEGLTQEECSERMNVARTTVQGYTATPEKNGAAAGRGRSLRIEGGDYKLYDENEKIYGCGRCRRHRQGHGQGLGYGQGQGYGRGYGQRRGRVY